MSRSEIEAAIDKAAESAGVAALKPLQRKAIQTFVLGKEVLYPFPRVMVYPFVMLFPYSCLTSCAIAGRYPKYLAFLH